MLKSTAFAWQNKMWTLATATHHHLCFFWMPRCQSTSTRRIQQFWTFSKYLQDMVISSDTGLTSKGKDSGEISFVWELSPPVWVTLSLVPLVLVFTEAVTTFLRWAWCCSSFILNNWVSSTRRCWHSSLKRNFPRPITALSTSLSCSSIASLSFSVNSISWLGLCDTMNFNEVKGG